MNSNNVWPGLQYRDAPAAIRWLTETFGFVEAIVVPGEKPDHVVHAELRWPGSGEHADRGTVMLHSADRESEFAAYNPPGTNSVYVVCTMPDDLFERARAADARVVRELRDEDHGSRGFTIADPEGNAWSFGTYAGS